MSTRFTVNDKSIENQIGKASLFERYVLFGAIVDHVTIVRVIPYHVYLSMQKSMRRAERGVNHAIKQ